MFEDLKAQLTAVEAKLRALVAGVRAQSKGLKGELDGIERDALKVFDGIEASATKAGTTVTQRVGGAKAIVQRLAPPK